MRRTAVALIVPAVLLLAACGSSTSASTSSSTTAAPSTAAVDAPASTTAAPAGLSCADIGGVFVPHATDGSGDCEPADQRAHCHVAPADQDGNYVAGFDLTPPRANGTVAAAQVSAMLAGASNADCWKAPK